MIGEDWIFVRLGFGKSVGRIMGSVFFFKRDIL
jgi:hypothetical protein